MIPTAYHQSPYASLKVSVIASLAMCEFSSVRKAWICVKFHDSKERSSVILLKKFLLFVLATGKFPVFRTTPNYQTSCTSSLSGLAVLGKNVFLLSDTPTSHGFSKLLLIKLPGLAAVKCIAASPCNQQATSGQVEKRVETFICSVVCFSLLRLVIVSSIESRMTICCSSCLLEPVHTFILSTMTGTVLAVNWQQTPFCAAWLDQSLSMTVKNKRG